MSSNYNSVGQKPRKGQHVGEKFFFKVEIVVVENLTNILKQEYMHTTCFVPFLFYVSSKFMF